MDNTGPARLLAQGLPAGRTRMSVNSFSATLKAARAGESLAFRALYDSLVKPITAFVMAKGVTDPDPVVNEVFLGAFRGLDRFEGNEEDFRKWVFGIAKYKILDTHRARYRQISTIGLDEVGEQPALSDVEREALNTLSKERVMELLDTLTEDQRKVLVLRLVSDLTISQISEVVDKPIGAVKQLQRRAVRRLAGTVGAAREGL